MISIFLSRAYPLFCYFTLIASFTMIIINRKWNSVGLRIVLPAISFIILFIPVSGLYLYKYFYGVFGNLSITSVILLLSFLVKNISNNISNNRQVPSGREKSAILYSVAVAGLILYPTSLGFVPVDLYRLGYHPRFLLVLILCLTILAWMVSLRFAAMLPVIAVIAFNLNILESENLWDYLVDPFIVF
ncbi:MAG: hypothetical protein AABZ07_05750, partial [Nitrospirota bacterium]